MIKKGITSVIKLYFLLHYNDMLSVKQFSAPTCAPKGYVHIYIYIYDHFSSKNVKKRTKEHKHTYINKYR